MSRRTSATQEDQGRGRRSRLLALAGAALLLGGALSAIASAQDPEHLSDPYATGERLAEDGTLPDTDHTPKAKNTALFQLVAGAAWDEELNDPATAVIRDSPTSFNDNLYTVAFSEQQGVGGFAAGASCEDPDPEHESGCTPVLYQHRTFDPAHGPQWRKVDLPGEDEPGYIGEVAWIARTGRALAVGGTGTYPRREPAWDGIEDPTSPEKADPAGKARAWLYEGGHWEELDLSEHTDETTVTVPPATPIEPEQTVPRAGMRGFTALACDPSQLRELCFAGGLGQIWKWEGNGTSGGFVGTGKRLGRVDFHSPDFGGFDSRTELEFPKRFRFRVREIRFAAGREKPIAVAVTSGCCTSSLLTDSPSVLTFSQAFGISRWYASSLMYSGNSGSLGHAADSVNVHQQRPDSLYSVTVQSTGLSEYKLSALATPGGLQGGIEPEPPSRITPRYCFQAPGFVSSGALPSPDPIHQYDAADLTRASLNTARLVAGDGDLSVDSFSRSPTQLGDDFNDDPLRGSPATHSGNYLTNCANVERSAKSPRAPDAVPDWVVGELRSEHRDGLGNRGLLVANPLRPGFLPETVNPNQPALSEVADLSYRPTTEEKLRGWAASQYYLLPSYGLSAIDIVGESATGWAVGDHGAILRLDAEQSARSAPEPDPPRLGARRAAALPDRSPYEPHKPPASGVVGLVPSLASRPEVQLSEPRFLPAGSPDPSDPAAIFAQGTSAREIAISRDGSEGWAVGPRGLGVTSLYHYEGGSWSLCDFFGVTGQLEPDPACERIAGIRLFTNAQGALDSVRLRAIARVPLEADSDPTNDDEFEAFAVGSGYIPEHAARRDFEGKPAPEPVVLRYRDGRWEFEAEGARAAITRSGGAGADTLIDVAFTAPDDGWIRSTAEGSLFHFDGERWIDCSQGRTRCADAEGRTAKVRMAVGQDGGLATAGSRTYLYGVRPTSPAPNTLRLCPMVIYHERGTASWRGSTDGSGGGYDPGFRAGGGGTCSEEQAIEPDSLVVGRRAGGAYEGWLLARRVPAGSGSRDAELRVLRLTPADAWQPFEPDDALSDYFAPRSPSPQAQLMLADGAGGLDAFIVGHDGKLLTFNRERERWELAGAGADTPSGVDALAPDGQGGFWAALVGSGQLPYFYRYTDHAPQEVFEEVPNPAGSQRVITAAAPGAQGSFWVATDSEALYRYDRIAGWDRVLVGGWDPGRVVVHPSSANAIAFNDAGQGIVVGEEGRMAAIAGDTVSLDEAAGTLCELAAPKPPCGTGRDLEAAAVAPDGSAIVAGEGLALLWRPAGGEFRAIERPDAAAQTTITAVAMPVPDRAWLATDTGFVFAGRLSAAGEWSWEVENVNERGDPLSLDRLGELQALRAIALDREGHGFAVGDGGVILERREDGEHPWRRLDTPFLDSFSALALPPGEGEGTLIGARRGAIFTYDGEQLELARAAQPCCGDPRLPTLQPVVGLALLPGAKDGQSEAWAAVRSHFEDGSSQLLHYSSDPADPLISPAARAEPLSDSPAPREGELAFAAFGHTRCLKPPQTGAACAEMTGVNEDYEVYAQRIVDELAARAGEPGGPAFAIFTGDTSDHSAPAQARRGETHLALLKLRRWAELVADRLEDAGVPLLGALGGGDISAAAVCLATTGCLSASDAVTAGESSAWREVMATRGAPWGAAEAPGGEGLILEPAPDGSSSTHLDEQGISDPEVEDPDGRRGIAPGARVTLGGARTHYAVDVIDPSRDREALARLIFVDTSLRSLQLADPIQNPLELVGGQLGWLEEMLCLRGRSAPTTGAPCTREAGQLAIVVSNAPSYSYGPGNLNQTQLDATLFERTLFEGDANLVVSGRVGWNGLYYARSDGVHTPEPGGSYPERPPESLPGQPPPIPFVVASGAGRFAPDGSGEAPDGFWHGYTIVRLSPSGDPAETIVEQRPIFDWISLMAREHLLAAGQKLALEGFGREPVGMPPGSAAEFTVRDDEISSPAITHRYDLVLADPEEPWVPCESGDSGCQALHARLAEGSRFLGSATGSADRSARNDMGECDPYLCLPERVGTIDRITGEVKAGNGKYPDTFAVAMLSVGDHVATYPLMFKKSPSFVIEPFALAPPVPASPQAAPSPPQPPAPPNPPQPNVPQPSVPDVPPPPPVPPIAAAEPPEPQPPAPPAPPPPTEQLSPLDLTINPASVTVSTPAAVIQPPTPPVNPAPPSGARREARQRQAATQKSGAGSAEESPNDAPMLGGDLANAPDSPAGSQQMTRYESHFSRAARARPEPSFTPLARPDQPSAAARGLLYGGGLTLAALALALGFTGVRPTPRRRPPEVPAPARCYARDSRR